MSSYFENKIYKLTSGNLYNAHKNHQYDTVIGIRTYKWSISEENLYNKLLQAFSSENIFVIVDETKSKVEIPSHIKKIAWDDKFIDDHLLLKYNHFDKGIGWLCGDYFYYAFQSHVTAKFYWLIEPDVSFTFENINSFFLTTSKYNDDLLINHLYPLKNGEYWYAPARLITKDPYGCLFPFNRLSYEAILLCKKERQRLSKYYKDNNIVSYKNNPISIHFPNDEVLVVNTLLKENKSVKELSKIFPASFEYFSYHKWISVSQEKDFIIKDQVIHPVRNILDINERLLNEVSDNIELNDFINNIVVDESNIDLLANNVANNIANKIHKKIQSNWDDLCVRSNIIGVKNTILSNLNRFPKAYNLWEWESNTIVLDFYDTINNKIYSMDFVFKNNVLFCYTFERKAKDSKWIDKFKNIVGIELIDDKILLFSAEVAELNILDEKIIDVLDLFYEKLDL